MDYQPFLISNFRTGMMTAVDPWLLPKDAFVVMENAYLYRGILSKRKGYVPFVETSHSVTAEAYGTGATSADLIVNGGMETWTGGDNVAPDNWTTYGTGCAIAKEASIKKAGSYSAKQTGNGTNAYGLYQDLAALHAVSWWKGRKIVFGAWVYATTAARAYIVINTNTPVYSSAHTGGGAWEWLEVTLDPVPESATYLQAMCYIGSGTSIPVYVDGATLYELPRTFTHTAAHIPLRPGSIVVTGPDDCEIFTDNGDGTLTGDQTGTGTYDAATGEISVTFHDAPTGAIILDYYFYPGLPITGIFTYYDNVGGQELLIFDTRRVMMYDSTNACTIDLVGEDVFTGDESNLVWLDNWNGVAYFTNHKDALMQYDGSDVEDVLVDTDDDDVSEMSNCLLCFNFKNRLVLLNTKETNAYGQRARWSKNGKIDFTNNEYVDAPTADWIVAARFLQDRLIVFFERSIWELAYTADYLLPFEWRRIDDTEGAIATFSLLETAREILALGPTSIIACDVLDVSRIDQAIPDYTLTFNRSKIGLCYAVTMDEIRQYIIAFPSIESDVCDKDLVFNYQDKCWSAYDLPFQCFGFYTESTSYTWDDANLTWDSDIAWDEKALQAGYPTTLGGAVDGKIYQINNGDNDDGAAIQMHVAGGNWNPFVEQGMGARLKCIDFLVDVNPGTTLTLNLYLDDQHQNFLTKTLDCSPESGAVIADKLWATVDFDGIIGNFFELELTHNAVDQPVAIHAICPWFAPAGRMRYEA